MRRWVRYGFFQDLCDFSLGISEARATWIVKWIDEKLTDDRARAEELIEVLGRIAFSSSAVEIILPCLGPLHAWASSVPEYANLPLPAMLRLVFKFIRTVFADPSMFMLQVLDHDVEPVIAFLGDAHASMSSVGVGGHQATVHPSQAAWFATELLQRVAPWAFGFGDENFRSIASLELYTTLLCLKLLPLPANSGRAVLRLSIGTDNQGNSYALKRWSTTRFPLFIMMEIAVESRKKGVSLDLQWIPRQQNDLTNCRTVIHIPSENANVLLSSTANFVFMSSQNPATWLLSCTWTLKTGGNLMQDRRPQQRQSQSRRNESVYVPTV